MTYIQKSVYKEALEGMTEFLKEELDKLSEPFKWDVSYEVDGWDFMFVCSMEDFKRQTSSHDFMDTLPVLIARLKKDAFLIHHLWEKEYRFSHIEGGYE